MCYEVYIHLFKIEPVFLNIESMVVNPRIKLLFTALHVAIGVDPEKAFTFRARICY